uniref:hypothetical protein n=1 Tax=Streptomyces odontomachi TaxID=2944940 RepID=UPI0035A9195E
MAGGTVHCLTDDGTVLTLDVRTGSTQWSYTCGGEPSGVLPDEEQPDDEPACLLPGEAPLLVQTEKSVRLPLRGSSPK